MPGQASSNLSFPKFKDNVFYVKELVFRSLDHDRFSTLEKEIKDLQKKKKQELAEKIVRQDLIEQEVLKINKGKKPIMKDLCSRPTVGSKKAKGQLECHLNGFRYAVQKN